ncbi:MAG: hypothetical protein JNJ47_07795 [Alphaproteobacteria bacterium]|nr:hypothetical protein [Alphaproteobacteria bacterium]
MVGDLVAAGVIGAALGALISDKKNRGENSLLGAIAFIAIMASLKAGEKAKRSSLSTIVEEDDAIYKVSSSGKRKFIKQIDKEKRKVRENFILR